MSSRCDGALSETPKAADGFTQREEVTEILLN